MDVRIGIVRAAKEIELEIADDAKHDAVAKEIETTLAKGTGVLWLTDRKGRRVGVPVEQISYVEIGAPVNERRVGFGAP